MRSQSEPFYSLLNKSGRRDFRWALKNHGLSLGLMEEAADHTWFSLMMKLGRRK